MGFSLKKLFGGSPTSASFNFPIAEARQKIDELSEFGRSKVTGPSDVGQLVLQDILKEQQRASGGLAEQQQAQQATAQSNQALFGGGASAGSGERIARAATQQGIQSQQGLFGQFGDIRSEALQSDLTNEQARRDRARDLALQSELGILGARTSAELAKTSIQAQRDAQKSGRTARALGAVGGLFGGQRGAAFGSFVGGGFT